MKLTNAEKIQRYLDLGMWVEVQFEKQDYTLVYYDPEMNEFISSSVYPNFDNSIRSFHADVAVEFTSITPIPRKPVLLEVEQRVEGIYKDCTFSDMFVSRVKDTNEGISYELGFDKKNRSVATIVVPHWAVIPTFDEPLETTEKEEQIKPLRFNTNEDFENPISTLSKKIDELIEHVNRLNKQ